MCRIPYATRHGDESAESPRWQGQKSSFPWEQDALDHIKTRMPEAEPYRAWQTFTFTAGNGHVREVDLFIATPGGLFLVEIKSHPGDATNNGYTWLFRDGSTTRTIDNPLHFTDQKSKELSGQLQRAADELKTRLAIPRIEACCFPVRGEPRLRLRRVPAPSRLRPGGPGRPDNLHGIWTRVAQPATEKRQQPCHAHPLEAAPGAAAEDRHRPPAQDRQRRPVRTGSEAFDAGPTWQDYLARNPPCPLTTPEGPRLSIAASGATDAERKSVQRAAHREYLALQGITHDGIVRAEQYSDELLPGPRWSSSTARTGSASTIHGAQGNGGNWSWRPAWR